MRDLELLHHYTTSTYVTLTRGRKEHEKVWQETVPQLALEHEFLMHGILALSALHLAHKRLVDSKQYSTIAANHEGFALPLFRSNASRITRENCTAVFAFSALVVIYAMASLEPSEDRLFVDFGIAGKLPKWIQLLHGIYTLLSPAWQWIAEGPMASIMKRLKVKTVSSQPNEVGFNALLLSFASLGSSSSRSEAELCTALEYVRGSFWVPFLSDGTFGVESMPCISQIRGPSTFAKLLGERRPQALIILAHHSVLLRLVGPSWFMDNLVQRVVSYIHENLDEEWKGWISWPLQQIQLGD
jgi:hypothetical protein